MHFSYLLLRKKKENIEALNYERKNTCLMQYSPQNPSRRNPDWNDGGTMHFQVLTGGTGVSHVVQYELPKQT